MNPYFFKMTKEEKENILDKHKTLYDGYAVRQNPPNMTPLYTQDLANDKGGITINSKGEVGKYNNKLYIKESKDVCEQCGGGLVEGDVCEQCGSSKMSEFESNEGIYDVQDLSGDFDYTEEEMKEGFFDDMKGAFGFGPKPDKVPYMANEVKSIISNIKSAENEEQLDSALNMYFNFIDRNQDKMNKSSMQVYVQRIMSAYKRKADELGNYLGSKDIDNIMSDVEEDLEFSDDTEKIKESLQESLKWFKKFEKYN